MNTLKSIHSRKSWSVACVSAACLLGAAQVPAGASAPRSVTVSYRDLDLTTIAGATTLYQRLKTAANTVCDSPGFGLSSYQEWHSCYKAALSNAVAKVNSPILIAVHRGQGKAPTTTAMLTK
jgi:UrcA family protein